MCSAEHPILVISIMPISSLNPLFDNLLESSHRDDFKKWSIIGFSEAIMLAASIWIYFMHLIVLVLSKLKK